MTDITYEWGIAQLEVAPSEDGLTDVVKTAHWTLTATDGEYTASSYGSVGMGEPDPETFTPYAELSKAHVISWLEAKLDVEQLHAGLTTQIDAQRTPQIITPPLPWA